MKDQDYWPGGTVMVERHGDIYRPLHVLDHLFMYVQSCSLLVSEQFTTKSAEKLHNMQILFSFIQPGEIKGHRLHQ